MQPQTAMAIEAIIFDCDGTLVDSLPLASEVLVEYLASLGVALSVDDAAFQNFGVVVTLPYASVFGRSTVQSSLLAVCGSPSRSRRTDHFSKVGSV